MVHTNHARTHRTTHKTNTLNIRPSHSTPCTRNATQTLTTLHNAHMRHNTPSAPLTLHKYARTLHDTTNYAPNTCQSHTPIITYQTPITTLHTPLTHYTQQLIRGAGPPSFVTRATQHTTHIIHIIYLFIFAGNSRPDTQEKG